MVKIANSYFEADTIKALWRKVLRVIMEYITVDGRFTRVYGYHFSLLNHFRYKVRVSFPYYLLCSLRKSLDDHKKNPRRFPILHTSLIRLIVEHYQKMPVLANLEASPIFEDDDTEPNCSRFFPNLSSARTSLCPPMVQTGKIIPNPLTVKDPIVPKPGSPSFKTRSIDKNPPAKNLVSYSEDSPESANNYEPFVVPSLDRNAKIGSHVTPDPANICCNTDRDPSVDFLDLARNNANNHFKLLKWDFHEINELKIKNWSLQSKLE